MAAERLQINVRSNSYSEALIKACIDKGSVRNKSIFVHEAIEKLAFEILGPEEIMNIRLYEQYSPIGIVSKEQ